MPKPSKSLEILANLLNKSPLTEEEIIEKASELHLFFGPGVHIEGVLIDYQDLGLFKFDPETQRYSLRKIRLQKETEATASLSKGPER